MLDDRLVCRRSSRW